jgi:hypothetical protein
MRFIQHATILLALAGAACQPRPAVPLLPTRYPAPDRLVAVGDLHGDLAATRRALRLAGAIDDSDRWTGGRLVLVQTGDQFDRGDGELAILGLLERLEAEAVRAGGAVHVLNGNHEFLNVKGNMRYVTPGGFAEFAGMPGLDLGGAGLEGFPAHERPRRAAMAPGGPVARRLARRNVAAIVGDSVFVHGGILPATAIFGLDRINEESRQWLRGEIAEPPEVLFSRWGPVWSRHFSSAPDDADCALLGRSLRLLGAARMVVGHTVQEEGPRPHCGGLVWCIDTGLSDHYGGPTAVLEIVGGEVRVLRRNEPERAEGKDAA